MGKILIVELKDNDEWFYQQLVEWLSHKLTCKPMTIKSGKNSFEINYYNRTLSDVNGNITYLTSKEFDLLYFLYSHKGQVFTKEQLYENVWGYDNVSDSSNLTSFIRKLRKKIEPNPEKPQYIITVWGVGYKFSEEKP